MAACYVTIVLSVSPDKKKFRDLTVWDIFEQERDDVDELDNNGPTSA
jgi:hypothetical protein